MEVWDEDASSSVPGRETRYNRHLHAQYLDSFRLEFGKLKQQSVSFYSVPFHKVCKLNNNLVNNAFQSKRRNTAS